MTNNKLYPDTGEEHKHVKTMQKDIKENEEEPLQTDKEQTVVSVIENFNDLDTGWAWIILCATFGTSCILGGLLYAVGIIHSALMERYNESVSVTSWAGALHSALFGLGGPLSSAVIDRFSCRTAFVACGIFFVIGYMVTAFAGTIEVAIFSCGIIAGIGGALGYTTTLVVVSFNFKRRRNLALGIALSGFGVGVFILAPLMQLARDYYGPIGFFITLAAMSANIITFGIICFPSKLEMHTKNQRVLEARTSREKTRCCVLFTQYAGVMCNRAVICLCVSYFTFCVGLHLMFLYLPSFIVFNGFSALDAAFLVSLLGISSVIGRLLTGFVANLNRINIIYIFSGSMGIVAIACFIYPFISQYFAGHVIFVIIFGMFFGSNYVAVTGVTLLFLGIDLISAALGLQFFFAGIGALVGPIFGGLLVDVSRSYKQAILIAASFNLIGAISSAATICLGQRIEDTCSMHVDNVLLKQAKRTLMPNNQQKQQENKYVQENSVI